ncbi:MAG: endopeptidase La [Desulfobacterales bacterium]|nr:endopeptidase La [Desulfobacterales bacterium]
MGEIDNEDIFNIIEEDKKTEIPQIMPFLPMRDVVIFIDMLLPLFIGRQASIKAIDEAMAMDKFIFLVTQKEPNIENPKTDNLSRIGTVSKILRILKLPDGSMKILVQGIAKGKVIKFFKSKASYRVNIEILPEESVKEITLEIKALMKNVRESCEKILSLKGDFNTDIGFILENISEPGKLADLVSSNLRLKVEESQKLLEIISPVERLKKVNEFLSREVELSMVQAKIQSDVKEEISKNQKDYFLREQVRAIYKELGEADDKFEEVEEYKRQIKRAKMPKEAEKEAIKQLKRFEKMHPESAECSIVRTYLDWLVELPWSKFTKDIIDIKKSKNILDKDHYGLDKIKDRILEYLSVRKLNPKSKGPILCFVGPPGVGKTSLGKSIARSMNRKFVRVSLGGIRDEAEIRGHRRTYVGALPGRLLQGLKQCKSNNPVFMMDEIDKIGTDFRGDPSSALLEVLDPEQNFSFSDHYLNLPFDLSKVMFILTANLTDTIPFALIDRMEIVNLSGYTEEEKQHIATKYLLPRQIKENGLKKNQFSITDKALLEIINKYTSEAGLRNLEREIGKLCRKVARKIAENEKGPFNITPSNLSKFLGVPKFFPEMDKERSQIGRVTGLAWTSVGGEVLYIEASLMPGKGELILTGQLGEVMQESGRAAVSYARSNLRKFKLKQNCLENVDIHIHVPSGATPKDGPSAGIAMATALVSVLTKKPVKNDIAMTGEITLRGRVLPIGGLKEKCLGALREGISTVIIPKKNEKDISELPENVKSKIKFITVKHINQVLKTSLEEKVKK